MAKDFEVSFPFVAEARRLFDPRIVDKAQDRTITALKGKIATRISKAARNKFNVKAQRIKQALRISTAYTGGIRSASLLYSGQRVSLFNFSARPRKISTTGQRGHLKGVKIRRKGASVKVAKGKKPYVAPGGFIAPGASGNVHIFQRSDRTDSNSALRLMTGPAIAQMVSSPDVLDDYVGAVNEEFPRIFESKLNHLLEQAAK